ncbi:sensor histidine kinase [Methyloraptor flagellatus]|uniref:histidine kinase n=1 Tax=Methyloraptor flagellatus TaxID=3162530 RepID=A0AAU7XAL9_9HYPH
MTRIATVTRTAFALMLGVTAVWILMIGYLYRNAPGEGARFLPAPRQVAAMVALVETASTPEQIETVRTAFGSDRFDLRIEPGSIDFDASGASATAAAPYEAALGRPVAVHFGLEDGTWISRTRWGSRNTASIAVPLSGAGRSTSRSTPLHGYGARPAARARGRHVRDRGRADPLADHAAADRGPGRTGRGGRPCRSRRPPAPLPDMRWRVVEIRAVASAFERLQRRLGSLLAARLALVGGIAHDVRTFATRLRLRVDGIADDQERTRAIADIEDMIRLLDDALIAGRAGTATLDLELFDLDRFVADEIGDRRALGQSVDVAIVPGTYPVLADRVALKRILGNVVDNAINYGRCAHVRLAAVSATAVLTIADEGPGVAEADRETLFEPFTRLDPSRNRRTGGSGLGLAVTRTLVEAHDGSIRFVDAARGAMIEIRLPLYASGSG